MRADQLESAQNGLKLIRGLPVMLVGLSLALFGIAVAVANAWTISTALLGEAAWAAIFYGIFHVHRRVARRTVAAGGGDPARDRAVREPSGSRIRDPRGFVVLLLWWAPTPATREPALALILIVLLGAGTEALRRQLMREHPDADMGVAIERVRERAANAASGAREGASRAVTEATSSPPGGTPNGDHLE